MQCEAATEEKDSLKRRKEEIWERRERDKKDEWRIKNEFR